MLLLAAFLVLNERGDLFIFLYEIVQNRVQRFMFGYFKTSFDIMGAVVAFWSLLLLALYEEFVRLIICCCTNTKS